MKLTYKLVSAALAIIIIAVIVFTPLVYVRIESLATQLLVTIGNYAENQAAQDILNEKGQVPDHIGIEISIAGLFGDDAQGTAELVSALSDETNTAAMEAIEPLIAPLITFVAVLAVLVICAIVTAVLAFAAKDNRKVICSGVAGVFLSLMVPQCFKAISTPLLNGDITLAKIAGSSWISLLGDIDGVELVSTFWAVPVVFGIIILWTLLYNYTLPADEKKKRLVMIGEAEEE